MQDYSEDKIGSRLSLTYGNFKLVSYYAQNFQKNFTSATFPSTYRNQRLFLDLGYEKSFSKKWKMQVNATVCQLRNVLPNGPNIPAFPESDDLVVEMTHNIEIGQRTKVMVGSSMYRLSGEWRFQDNFIVPSYDQEWWNAYFQADYEVNDKVKLIGGGQFNKPEGIDLDFVPRLGSIFRLNKHWGGKLLYGEAFRAAFPGETQIVIPTTLLGTEGLSPETVTTIEAQLFYESKKAQATISYFSSEQNDLITRVPSPNPNYRLEFANKGSLESRGTEIEGKYVPNSKTFITGSYTINSSENDSGLENPTLIPRTLGKLGITYAGSHGFSFGVFNTYASDFGSVKTINPNVAVVNPEPSSFNNLTA
ncbi:MAG: TonB-dependent receptor, partial [Pseudomonadales bacterium]|nr:TonB-dependent receptor [Pseudomonadales bacterium]